MMPAQRFTTTRFAVLPASPLSGVSDEVWKRFSEALEVQGSGDVSLSGGYGAYDMRPRRLAELGYAKMRPQERRHKVVVTDEAGKVVSVRAFDSEAAAKQEKARIDGERQPLAVSVELGRQVQVCEFVGRWTRERFLADTVAQYTAFRRSIAMYDEDLREGRLKRPEGATRAGALAILHRGGRGALEAWPELFEATRSLHERVKGAF